MRTWTLKTFASLGALFVGLSACGEGPVGHPAAGGPTTTPPVTEHPTSSCTKTELVEAGSSFARTAGPDIARFRYVAATKAAVFASSGESLHRSVDEGATWSLVDADALRGAWIAAIATVGDEVFVSVESTGSVYRSTDAGATWSDASPGDGIVVMYLTAHGDALFAAAGSQTFRWNAALAKWDALPVGDQAFDVIESDGAYLYGNSMYQPGVYRLPLDVADAVWAPVKDLPEWGYTAFAFDGARGFASNATQLFQTTDGGASWKSTGQSVQVRDLLVAGAQIFAATSHGMVVSTDGGATWTTIGTEVSDTPFSLAATGTHVFVANNALHRATTQDVSKSSWERLHPVGDSISGLAATEGAVLSISDGHLLRSTDGGATWSESPAGDYVSALTVHEGTAFVLGGDQSILASTDDGASFQVRSSAPGDGAWVNFLASTSAGLIAGVSTGAGSYCTDVQDVTTTLFLSTDGGVSWQPAMNGFPITFTDCYDESYTPGLTGVAEAGGVLFATGLWKGTFRSTDGGAVWAAIATPESIGSVSSFAPIDGSIFAVASAGGIARSDDGGVTWVASGLGSLEVASLIGVGGALFATVPAASGADAGVYTSTDLGVTWVRLDAAFDARVISLATQGRRLFAGTLDQSVWSLSLTCAAD